MKIKAIITDIEGTTTDIHFVHKVLFPYSRENIHAYLIVNQNKPEVITELNEIRKLMDNIDATLDDINQQLIQWIDSDVKIAPLKNLQGFIWQQGFQQGEFKGHVYADAYENLIKWHQQKIKLYIYSSGSVKAQQLLFQYSTYGDIRYLFDGYFDTKVGPKKEASSYAEILKQIQCQPEETLFLSDVVAECDAAYENNMQTRLLNRDNQVFEDNQHLVCHTFNEIIL